MTSYTEDTEAIETALLFHPGDGKFCYAVSDQDWPEHHQQWCKAYSRYRSAGGTAPPMPIGEGHLMFVRPENYGRVHAQLKSAVDVGKGDAVILDGRADEVLGSKLVKGQRGESVRLLYESAGTIRQRLVRKDDKLLTCSWKRVRRAVRASVIADIRGWDEELRESAAGLRKLARIVRTSVQAQLAGVPVGASPYLACLTSSAFEAQGVSNG